MAKRKASSCYLSSCVSSLYCCAKCYLQTSQLTVTDNISHGTQLGESGIQERLACAILARAAPEDAMKTSSSIAVSEAGSAHSKYMGSVGSIGLRHALLSTSFSFSSFPSFLYCQATLDWRASWRQATAGMGSTRHSWLTSGWKVWLGLQSPRATVAPTHGCRKEASVPQHADLSTWPTQCPLQVTSGFPQNKGKS